MDYEEGEGSKSHMAPVERVSILFPAFLDFNEEFKDSSSVQEQIRNIVATRIAGKMKFVV
jgi:hypothetical protein